VFSKHLFHRIGFTLIELLIVLAIVCLIMVLAIPAIQASREAARRTQCTSNERQLGVAFSNFEARNKTFPSCITLEVTGPLTDDFQVRMHNFMVDLLPFIEGGNLYKQYHRDAMFCAQENAGVIATPLQLCICPSAPTREKAPSSSFVPSTLFAQSDREHPVFGAILKQTDKKYSTTYQGGITDYSVPTETEDGLARHLGFKLPASGDSDLRSMFPSPFELAKGKLEPLFKSVMSGGSIQIAEQFRARDVKDGLSRTFMLTEVAGRPQRWQLGKHTGTLEPLTSAWADPWIAFRIEGIPLPSGERCVLQCDNNDEIYSFHRGGANFLFADGHVEFLSSETEPRLIEALMTPDQDDNKAN
jgi:prepilin-type processing-associated H-X9-DG protein/prepilin-type N-terminal cleavage/methylation domain-containing protein